MPKPKKEMNTNAKILEKDDSWLINDRWEIFKSDGCVYDTQHAAEVPSYIFELRDKLIKNYIKGRRNTNFLDSRTKAERIKDKKLMPITTSTAKKEKHCNKCSYMSDEGLIISGCAYCGCHISQKQENWEEELLKLLSKVSYEEDFRTEIENLIRVQIQKARDEGYEAGLNLTKNFREEAKKRGIEWKLWETR